jgi:tRNA G37 N-methylase Trm5
MAKRDKVERGSAEGIRGGGPFAGGGGGEVYSRKARIAKLRQNKSGDTDNDITNTTSSSSISNLNNNGDRGEKKGTSLSFEGKVQPPGLDDRVRSHSATAVPKEVEDEVEVLLISAPHVKAVKVFLEAQRWLDKTRRITTSEVRNEDDQRRVALLLAHPRPPPSLPLSVPTAAPEATPASSHTATTSATSIAAITNHTAATVTADADAAVDALPTSKQVKVKSAAAAKRKPRTTSAASASETTIMAVPITAELSSLLLRQPCALFAPLQQALAEALGCFNTRHACISSTQANIMSTGTDADTATTTALTSAEIDGYSTAAVISESESTVVCAYVTVGRQCVRTSKALLASSYRRATEYLDSVVRRFRLVPTDTAAAEYPRKYELVGDVLMVPEDALCGPLWQTLLGTGDSGDSWSTSRTAVEVWAGLAGCFGVARVARKARVDSGPRRDSHVTLLLPPLGRPDGTGPGSPGWTEVVENGISFGFDITRVMFCSGNCTERIRMGKETVAGETIVDLYCGVGYYTIPFLLHGKAAHVHACEWNPNSILALRENLRKAGLTDRCTIYEGDNRLTAPALAGLADRVCLGLLPSSTGGWPLAAAALKPTGGVLYVHENVRDVEIDQWVIDTCAKFEELFLEVLLREKPVLADGGGTGNTLTEGADSAAVEGLDVVDGLSPQRKKPKPMRVVCRAVERVKSYAPHVMHIVADLICTPY